MARLWINPRYRELLEGHGLASVEDFLRLSGVIVCGHPDRHVARVVLGEGSGGVRVFLKKEHRVPWRERIHNAWAGFGLVSKSWREMAVLRQLPAAGINGPEAMAAGEAQGRAFLLVAEVQGAVDLPTCLMSLHTSQRQALARQLGAALARIDLSGFDCPDLCAKHVLVVPDLQTGQPSFCFLDWQRAKKRSVAGKPTLVPALARLDATLADNLASPRERLLCLRAYRKAFGDGVRVAGLARALHKQSQRLRQRRHLRESRQVPLPAGTQELVWLEGEALCVTRRFAEELQGRRPSWLSTRCRRPCGPANQVRHTTNISLPGMSVDLIRRWSSQPLQWFLGLLRGRRLRAPEVEQAATIFRLQRFGVPLPRLLAFGQRRVGVWATASFLLTEAAQGTVELGCWLSERRYMPSARQRRQVLVQAGRICRQLHEAGYSFDVGPADLARQFRVLPGSPTTVSLAGVHGLRRSSLSPRRIRTHLTNVHWAFLSTCTRSERLRFLLAYFGIPRLTHSVRAWISQRLFLDDGALARTRQVRIPNPVLKGALSA